MADPTTTLSGILYDLPESSTLHIYWRALSASMFRKRTQYRMKRLFDLVFGTMLLIVLSPLMLLIAALIKTTSRGPILYRSVRLMQNGNEFTMLKFRTMVKNADAQLEPLRHLNEASGNYFKVQKDPRVTKIGKVLRVTFLDELPQLFNVLRGEMSLVGPRPCLPQETSQMEGLVIFRFAVPQGITGPWQTGGYHSVPFEERLRIERDYVASWSFWRDLVILLQTFPVIFGRVGR